MCGILAIFCNKTPNDMDKIIERSKLLHGRGPDKSIYHTKEGESISIFYRLCINDTSSLGDQPMECDGVKLMCNGEIYNSKELMKEYDISCKSESDCEVILHLYKKLGFTKTVSLLDGVFAIVIIDGNKVYLARDRIGVRPLHCGVTQDGYLAVSSVPECLEGWCSGIKQFQPGICVKTTIEKPGFKFLPLSQDLVEVPQNRLDTGVGVLYDVLKDAVKKRLLSDRPIGCLLSGGLDSSCVTALLCELLGAENVRTYSIGMECSTDLKYAKIVAEHFGTKHTEILFTPDEGFEVIPELIQVLGTYDITTIRASVGMYLMAKYISKNTEDIVIFSGEGSDEIMCGYLYFHNAPTALDAELESLRLIKNLHVYDVLRADRTISINGLELRVPFLDRKVVDTALSLPLSEKVPVNGYEKYALRKSFEGKLPHEVLWRRKEGFSDGVSGTKKSWYEHIQDRVESLIPDSLYNGTRYPSKEAMYYRLLFEKYFPTYELKLEYWMPKWSDTKDPSGRMIEAFKK